MNCKPFISPISIINNTLLLILVVLVVVVYRFAPMGLG